MWYRNLMLLSAKVNRLNLIARCAAAYGALNMVAKALVVRFNPGIIRPVREGAPDQREHTGWPVCSQRWHGVSSPSATRWTPPVGLTSTPTTGSRTRIRTKGLGLSASLKPIALVGLG